MQNGDPMHGLLLYISVCARLGTAGSRVVSPFALFLRAEEDGLPPGSLFFGVISFCAPAVFFLLTGSPPPTVCVKGK